MADLTVDNLQVNGSITIDGKVWAKDEIILATNGVSALNVVDQNGVQHTAIFLDQWKTLVVGPLRGDITQIQYIPTKTEFRPMFYEAWDGVLARGMTLESIGVGGFTSSLSTGYPRVSPGSGLLEITTGTNNGDGVRMKLGDLATTTVARTECWFMLNADASSDIDLQFGFYSKTSSAAIRFRYLSMGGAVNWVCTTDNGSGGVSNSTIPITDAAFRRQFKISWENSYGGNPADVTFSIADLNNEMLAANKATHTFAMGSLPPATEKLYAYGQFRNTTTVARKLFFDHCSYRAER